MVTQRGRPAPHGRAPLRRATAGRGHTRSRFVPPLTGGLGWARFSASRSRAEVVPPLTGGLRCGSRAAAAAGVRLHRVVPGLTGQSCRCGLTSETCPVVRCHCRPPPLHGRAPVAATGLGQRQLVDSVVPPLTGGLRCGKSLRGHGPPVGSVVPPLTGRAPLRRRHLVRLGRLLRGRSSRPSRAGSRCGGADAVPVRHRLPGRPAPHRAGSVAAPVLLLTASRGRPGRPAPPHRAGSVAAGAAVRDRGARLVVPPLTGGLRCGADPLVQPLGVLRVVPPLTGGLRCGRSVDLLCLRQAFVVPPLTGGLQLRRTGAGRARRRRHWSSRPSRAGSVAARRWWRCRWRCRPVVPPLAGAGLPLRRHVGRR